MDFDARAQGETGDGLAGRLSLLRRVLLELPGIENELWRAGSQDLGAVLGELDDALRVIMGAQCAVIAEAMERGDATGPDGVPMTVSAWVREWAPSTRFGGHRALMEAATVCREAKALDLRLREAHGDSSNEDSEAANVGEEPGDLADVMATDVDGRVQMRRAVLAGHVTPRAAQECAREMSRLAPRLIPEAVPTVWAGLLHLGRVAGFKELRAVRAQMLAEHGQPGELDRIEEAARRNMTLSTPAGDGDLYDYRLRVNAEGKAVLEAALGPLSRPRPSEHGPDLRSAGQRRAEALLEIVGRGMRATSVGAAAKATLHVTLDADSLSRELRGGGHVVGSLADGTVLAPGTLRRIACDAGIIPAVLGSRSQVLDEGEETRFFNAAQTRHLVRRDGGCSFPGCDIPGDWCHAHHVRHWADGGPTDVSNGAMLCGFHHHLVHRMRFGAAISETGVEWDLTPGSYDAGAPRADARDEPPPCDGPPSREKPPPLDELQAEELPALEEARWAPAPEELPAQEEARRVPPPEELPAQEEARRVPPPEELPPAAPVELASPSGPAAEAVVPPGSGSSESWPTDVSPESGWPPGRALACRVPSRSRHVQARLVTREHEPSPVEGLLMAGVSLPRSPRRPRARLGLRQPHTKEQR